MFSVRISLGVMSRVTISVHTSHVSFVLRGKRHHMIITPIEVEQIFSFCNPNCWEIKPKEIIESMKLKKPLPDVDQFMIECSICGWLVVRYDKYWFLSH